MSNNIAVVGTRGAGKTVFTTVLANYLARPRDGVQLIADSLEIEEYVAVNYARLQRGEWLDSTNTEEKLSWKFKVQGTVEQLTLWDCPGEDIERLFARKSFSREASRQGQRDRELVEYLLGASKILVLINLADFIEESNAEEVVRRQKLREYSLREFLQAIRSSSSRSETREATSPQASGIRILEDDSPEDKPKIARASCHIAVVFTAYNQYQDLISHQYGGVAKFLARRVPALYYDHFDQQGVTGIAVSAVGEVDVEGRPKPGFKPVGLNTVVKWLIDPQGYVESRSQNSLPIESPTKVEQKTDANTAKKYQW